MSLTELGSSDQLLAELATWVTLETPTTDAAAVNRLLDRAEADLAGAGAALTRISGQRGYGDHLIARTPGQGKAILVIGHLDTVWPAGTLATMPYRVEGDLAHGPGIYDMKASSLIGLHVVRGLLRRKIPTRLPVTLLLTSDEEVGSPTSRAVIEREARESAYALVLEPASLSGCCVTARKGVGRYHMLVEGKAAHSGTAFTEGASAVVEMARQIIRIDKMVDLDAGITLNSGPIHGGTRPNVIAARAECEIDLRVPDEATGARVEAELLGLSALTPGCTVTVTGGMNRPPYGETPAGLALYARARQAARSLGMELPKQHRGGGSDANFTAALGVPTLDGLGCPGLGAHASHEYVVWTQLVPRAALLARLLETLD